VPDLRVVSLTPAAAGTWVNRRARISPVALLHVSLLLLIIANVGRIPVLDLGDRSAPLLINDLAVAAAVMAGLLASAATRSLILDRVALAGLLFASIGGLSALAAGPRFGLTAFQVMASLAYLARWCLYFALYVVVVNHVRARDVHGVWSTLERMMLVFAAFGVVQAIFLPSFALIVYPDQADHWDAQRHRLVSTILDPNIAAAFILTVLLVQFAQLASGVRVALWKPGLLMLALIMTLSRSGVAGLLTGGLVILGARGLSKRLLGFGVATIAGMVAAFPVLLPFAAEYNKLGISDASAASRVVTWQRAFATFMDSPWFGIGFNTYGYVQEHRGFERAGGGTYSAEGGLLFIAVMTGVVGLAAFVFMLWLVLRRCRAGWKDALGTPFERSLCIGAAAATVAVCVHSVFVNSLLVPFVMQPLWVLAGLVYVVRARMRQAASGVS
jgi:putative inorganic carbon (HCO3(-)) transporter